MEVKLRLVMSKRQKHLKIINFNKVHLFLVLSEELDNSFILPLIDKQMKKNFKQQTFCDL